MYIAVFPVRNTTHRHYFRGKLPGGIYSPTVLTVNNSLCLRSYPDRSELVSLVPFSLGFLNCI